MSVKKRDGPLLELHAASFTQPEQERNITVEPFQTSTNVLGTGGLKNALSIAIHTSPPQYIYPDETMQKNLHGPVTSSWSS